MKPSKKELKAIFKMQPKEAIAYLEKKRPGITWSYKELDAKAHTHTFTVAKVMKLDLLKDIKDALDESLKEGYTFKEFKERLKPILIKKGWYGRTEVFNPETGELKTITVGAKRLKTIYETNVRSAYNYGRLQHLQSSDMSYWMYASAMLPTTRDTHRAMHGAVYKKDHPFWHANYPPNGYNCKCKVRGYTEQMLKRRGIKPREHYETIADVGFTHTPLSGIDKVWQQKILDAPNRIQELALQERSLSDRYDALFESDKDIELLMLRLKPRIVINPAKKALASYAPQNATIYCKSANVSDETLRHEAGHRLDHALDFFSASLSSAIAKDTKTLLAKRQEIKALLTSKRYDDDILLHDIFYLSTKGRVGYQTREPEYVTDDKIHKELFASFFEAYLSKNRLGIIKRYFPRSYKKFLKLIAKAKESL